MRLWGSTRMNNTIPLIPVFPFHIGMFSLSALLIRLVSGVGLLTITATLTDTLALYVLPNRRKYRKTIYDEDAKNVLHSKSS